MSALVATDAAGEGVNLQRAHLMVNYDLPWNPNRIEQRFGRIHRIGQTEVCHMWNLVAAETREGEVYNRLLTKLAEQSEALGGAVFDVLGNDIFDKPLRDLLMDAVRYGDQPEVRAKLDEVVDAAVGAKLQEALKERALLKETMGATDVAEIRRRMEEADARRLQPHYVRSFFDAAFAFLGGQMRERETGRFEITNVPVDIRSRGKALGGTTPVVARYARVVFDKSLVAPPGMTRAQLLAPGHPLLDATVDLVLERLHPCLRQGTIFVADADDSEDPRALVYIEHAIQNARTLRDGNRQVVSRRMQFVEITEDWEPNVAGHAPYLDYRPATDEELALIRPTLEADWLTRGVEDAGRDFAIIHAVPEHLAEISESTLSRVALTREAVERRLKHEINHWDHRAWELKEQELAGRQPRMNSERARQRAEDLQARLRSRTRELDEEAQLSSLPPVVVGGALVIPRGMLERLNGKRAGDAGNLARETERVERLAVDAVLEAERRLGRVPEEKPRNNPGYDILSASPGGGPLLFIEVKGRVAGADEFNITKNEVLHALNKGDNYILAIVAVDGDRARQIGYVRRPFSGDDGLLFGANRIVMDWDEMMARATDPR
jgi:hypothetical protein